MPVHKFGINPEQLTVSGGGVSLSYIEKNFQRKGDDEQKDIRDRQTEKDIKRLDREISENTKSLSKLSRKNSDKHYITIWAEENGALANGKYEFSFGDGMVGKRAGYTVLTRSKILKIGLSVSSKDASPEEAVVTLVINGLKTNHNILKPHGKFSHVVDVSELELAPGDTINFITELSTKRITGAIISLLLEINL